MLNPGLDSKLHFTVVYLNKIEIFRHVIITIFMLQFTHKMENLNQNEICAVLCSKRQYKQNVFEDK